jgi:3-hydroxybutyryl-CoA dehydratase
MPKAATLRFDDLAIGQRAQFDVLLTEEMIVQFAELSGDYNPLHTDETYAQATQFGGRIAHGMLCAAFFSRLVGMHLPGRLALYLYQKTVFHKPCRTGMKLTVTGEILQKIEAKKTIVVRTQILDESGECLIDGEAMVKLLE